MTIGVVHHLHTLLVKTRNPDALRDLLLLSCSNPYGLPYTRAVFLDHAISTRHTFPWNTIIRAHAERDPPHAVSFYSYMRAHAVPHDGYTFPFLLKACCGHPCRKRGLEVGLNAHATITKLGFGSHLHVGNAVVSFYSLFGRVDCALQMFGGMPLKDVVSWSAIIACLGNNGLDLEALGAFQAMQIGRYGEKVEIDEIIMVSVITAVGNLHSLDLAAWVYCYVRRRNLDLMVSMGTALVVMLSKCGYINRAVELFEEMPLRNAQTWTSLIVGLAEHGRSRKAVETFNQMVKEGVHPDHIAFIGVLTACSHGGLLDEGEKLFSSMEKIYGMAPWMEHYGCMVDLICRSGNLEEAKEFINSMSIRPNAVIWRTLLGACVREGNVELAEHAKKKILELEPYHDGDYVLLSNVFGGVGKWLDKARTRSQMRHKGLAKTPGWSKPHL